MKSSVNSTVLKRYSQLRECDTNAHRFRKSLETPLAQGGLSHVFILPILRTIRRGQRANHCKNPSNNYRSDSAASVGRGVACHLVLSALVAALLKRLQDLVEAEATGFLTGRKFLERG